jgi:hypothetical protein
MMYRAYFKPDAKTEDGLIRFDMENIDDELMFVANIDRDLRYPFFVPFIDSDWVVQELVGRNGKGEPFYEGDIIMGTPIGFVGTPDSITGTIWWCDNTKSYTLKSGAGAVALMYLEFPSIRVIGFEL